MPPKGAQGAFPRPEPFTWIMPASQLARDVMRAPQVLRVDVAAEAVGGAVCEGDRLFLAVERRYRQHRPEYLVLRDAGFLSDIGNDGQRQEVTRPTARRRVAAPPAINRPPSALTACSMTPSMRCNDGLRNDRSHHRRRIQRIADWECAPPIALQHLQILLVDRPLDQQSRAVDAALPADADGARESAPGGLLQIRVGEHDHRRLAAQLEPAWLESFSGSAQHFFRRRAAADELDLIDTGVRDQGLADVGAARDDVDDPGRKTRLQKQLAQPHDANRVRARAP